MGNKIRRPETSNYNWTLAYRQCIWKDRVCIDNEIQADTCDLDTGRDITSMQYFFIY